MWNLDLDDQEWLKEYLSVSDLQKASGEEDLGKVKTIQLQVNTVKNSLGPLGHRLPSLVELRLNNSVVASLRDLGTTLSHIKVLWLNRCGVQQLGGASAFPLLEEVYLAFNNITDISPLAGLAHLTTLDLEGNQIKDIEDVQFMAECLCLRNLTLEGNPVALTEKYRERVAELLPFVQYLDDEEVGLPSTGLSGTDEIQRQAQQLVLKKTAQIDEELGLQRDTPYGEYVARLLAEGKEKVRPAVRSEHERLLAEMRAVTESAREARHYDPLRAFGVDCDLEDDEEEELDLDSITPRPFACTLRPDGAGRFSSRMGGGPLDPGTDASALTHHTATVFCGNAVKSLRSRKLEELDDIVGEDVSSSPSPPSTPAGSPPGSNTSS
eukprot:Sspe_Gene.19884::Locus_7272_Transcript_1_1_Confidence_1.000_Length_1536::g.19884::m.19884